MSKNTSVWLIIPQTNLHVGNESVVNFSVIDKSVQRDVVTGIPCINSSSLKGALKEYLTQEEPIAKDEIWRLFGSVKNEKADKDIKKKDDTQKGSAMFFDASLIAIPRPCNGDKPYEIVYCDKVIDEFIARATALRAVCDKNKLTDAKVMVEYDVFRSLCDNESLPIIARNCLENGESANLWYEQVVPSKSVFATLIRTHDATDLAFLDDKLNNQIVQIGANATIGYGYCMMMKL